jgi:predicted TPR repeat methyltransferase
LTEDYRNRLYARYVDTHLREVTVDRLKLRAPHLKHLIRQHFPKERSAQILELGCGHGAMLYFAQHAGYTNMIGVDVSPEQVEAAAKLGIDGVHQGDLLKTLKSHADGSLDMVIAFDVIEHLTKNELLDLTDEVQRVLKRGGSWLIHVPNAASPFFGRIRYGDYTHEQAFTQSSLGQLLRASGFSNIRCYEETPIIHNVTSLVRWLLWKTVRTTFRLILAAETGSGNEMFSQNLLAVADKS